MNTTDQILQTRDIGYTSTGKFLLSAQLIPIFQSLSTESLILIERSAWWAHIIGIFTFAVYITYSKHLHIFMAFPNTYLANLQTPGKMVNMPEVTNEVKIMLGVTNDQDTGTPPARFGAKDVPDLTRLNIMNAYACTECGRCTAECPANLTGKKLSPRKIMMDVRDRAEEIGRTKPGQQVNKTLLGDYITREEIFACTSCNACVEACPVQIDPLSIILQLRRYTAMEESSSPAEWNSMFSNIETNFAPWKFAASNRFKWSKE
jgi:heterodisulfide reductase subunit C